MPDRWPGGPALTRVSPGLFPGRCRYVPLAALPLLPSLPLSRLSPLCLRASVACLHSSAQVSDGPAVRPGSAPGRRLVSGPNAADKRGRSPDWVGIESVEGGSEPWWCADPPSATLLCIFLLHVALQDNDFCSHSLRVVERLLVEFHSVPSTVDVFLYFFNRISNFFLPLFHNSESLCVYRQSA